MVLDIAVTSASGPLIIVQLMMVLFIAAGLLGMYFHYRGSREFQLEMDPAMGGMALIWKVLQAKSPPTLSPGTMVQMGILGLGYTRTSTNPIRRLTNLTDEPTNLTNRRTMIMYNFLSSGCGAAW